MAVGHASPLIDGAKLRKMRQDAGLSVTKLARLIGISTGYLSHIERGQRPTVASATYLRICEAMGVDTAELRKDAA